MKTYKSLILIPAMIFVVNISSAQNPFIMDQFTADPTAREFNGRIYVYPSHDIKAKPGRGRAGWFCMEDYHVFSSSNLTDWTDHGVIVSQYKVNWVDTSKYSMWAPDCIERNGKYYFYFPANTDSGYGKGFSIGVAVADNPVGPYTLQQDPIKNVKGIDPNVFIDKDGQAYLYYSMGRIYVARLQENMLELASEPIVIGDLPTLGLVEGPFLFEKNGKYYMTYPHVQNKIERIEYAIGDNPMGPFKFTGVIMDESPAGCWTNHHSIIEYNDQWYLFYHHNDLSPKFDKNRSIRIDSLFFNEDGTIRKVKPSLRGVGQTIATQAIQIDRYSHISENGASIDFLDSLNTFKGWKTILSREAAWISYNAVDFGSKSLKTVQVNAASQTGGILQIRIDSPEGELLAEVNVSKGNKFNITGVSLLYYEPGRHNLFVTLKSKGVIEIDWIKFTE